MDIGKLFGRCRNRRLQSGFDAILILLFFMPVIYAFRPGTTVIPSNIAFITLSYIFYPFIYSRIKIHRLDSVNLFFICAITSFALGSILNKTPLKRCGGEFYMVFMIYAVYIGAIPNVLSYYIHSIKKYIIPIIIIFYIVTIKVGNIPGYFNIQRYCGLLFIPLFFAYYTPKRFSKILLFAIIIFSLYIDVTIRSHLLNIAMAIFMYSLYILPIRWLKRLSIMVVFLSFLAPLIFIFSALYLDFNIFRFGESISDFSLSDKRTQTEQSIMIDSRSGIYADAKSIMQRPEHILYGRGRYHKFISYLDETSFSDGRSLYIRDTTSFEAGMLSIFAEGGVIEALSIALVYLGASLYAIKRSKNKAMFIVAMWIAFRYLNLFLDDKILLNANTISTFILIGLCYNKHLLMLNDIELKRYIKYIEQRC